MSEDGMDRGEIEKIVERELPSFPIGIVGFGGGKAAFIRKDDGGNIRCEFGSSSTEEPQRFDSLPAGRRLNLQEYSDVRIIQVPPGSIDVTTYETLESNKDELYVRMSYEDASTTNVGVLGLDEKKMLQILTGKSGGLAIFSGGDISPEFALVMNQKEEGSDKVTVAIAFLTTQGVDNQHTGIKSIPGVYSFFKKLNDEFSSNSTPLQREVDKVFDRGVRKDVITETPARREILKSILMAHARLADVTGLVEHIDFIDTYLPKRTIGRSSKALDTELEVNKVLNTILIGRILPTNGNAEIEETQEEKRALDLKTDRAKKIYDFYHDKLGDEFGSKPDELSSTASGLMEGYILDLIDFVRNAKKSVEFSDLSSMLGELQLTRYGYSHDTVTLPIRSKVSKLEDKLTYYSSQSGQAAGIWRLIKGLNVYTDEKLAEALIKEHKSTL